ncbi:MAG: shikimate kinase [Chloroflexi bacterium]|nr:shikimate kinase [Chloroflexota bacterium]
MLSRNVIITGFMGTGKTAVAKLLAQRLHAQCVDMDSLIEERIGLTVTEIFGCYGEKFFRRQEGMLALELAQSSGKVIATGGGTIVCEASRQTLARTGIIINLSCSVEEVLRRLCDKDDRPLLAAVDRLARVQHLLASRQPHYDSIPHQVDTSSLTVEEVVDRIMDILRKQAVC